MSDVVRYDNSASRWEVLQSQSQALAKSGFVPPAYRGKPDDILAAGLYGDTVGLAITSALSYIHVIEGKPTLSAEGMLALVRSRGHSINGTSTALAATVSGKRRDTGDELTVEWTIEMATRAKLDGKDNWKKYPEAMLWARAVSQLCRMLFSDTLLGLSYTPEEMGDIEVIEARVVDRTTGEISSPTPPATPLPKAAKKTATQVGPDNQSVTVVVHDQATQQRVGRLRERANSLTPDARKQYRTWLAEVDIDPNKRFEHLELDELEVAEALLDRLAAEAPL